METVLSDKEQVMYELVLKVLDGEITHEQAAARAMVSTRTVYRKIDAYLKGGMGALAHGSRGRSAPNALDADTRREIVELYRSDYPGYNFTHFHQKLLEEHAIALSYPTVRSIPLASGVESPKAHRRRPRGEHPTRRRRAAFGELVQMDASVHPWFEGVKTNLHLSIDDATSRILSGHFEEQETLHGYFMLFAAILRRYGCPEEFYTDRRTVFAGRRDRSPKLEDDAGTQFRMAAARMGALKLHVTSVPQAKGRIERSFQTFQDRLVNEMRPAQVCTMEQANAFLAAFIDDHNERYALDSEGLFRAFGDVPSEEEIDMGLSVVCERKVSGGCVSFRNRSWAPFDEFSRKRIAEGKKVLVLRTLSDRLYLVDGENAWPLVNMERMGLATPEDVRSRMYVPPKGHPWKEASYRAMLKRLHRAA